MGDSHDYGLEGFIGRDRCAEVNANAVCDMIDGDAIERSR